MLVLEGLVSFKTGKLNSNAAKIDGKFPFFTCSQETFLTDTWSFDGEYVLLGGNNAAGIYPLKYFKGKFDAYQRTYAIRSIDEKKLLTRYTYYAFRLQLELMKSISTGVTTKFLTLSLLNKTKIPVPPILTQQKIVSILSVYDDFIENNTRRIRILEEMAQAIYSEWFVNFRFPGYEGVRMVESEFGQIPEEWKILELDEIADIQWGDTSTTKSSYITDGFIAYSASGPDGFLDYYDYDRVGIVLSAIGANCGKTWYVRGKWSCIKNTIRFWAKNDNLTTEFLYFASINPDFWPRRGAAQPFISQGDAKKIKILCPEKKVVDEFSKHVICLMMMIDNLSYQNTNLRRTRDLLLPKLISGEIDVSGLDIRIPEVEA